MPSHSISCSAVHPYFDLEVYSDRPDDLSKAGDYHTFFSAYREIIGHACGLMAPDAFACWVVGDVRDKRGWFRGLTGDTVEAFAEAGFQLYNDAILLTQAGSLPMRVRKAFEKVPEARENASIRADFRKGKCGQCGSPMLPGVVASGR